MNTTKIARFLGVALFLGLVANAASAPPAEPEVRKAIEQAFNDVYRDGYKTYGVTRVDYSFSPAQFGRLTRRQMFYGKDAEPVWPVRVTVGITLFRGGSVYKTVERGAKSDDVFFFYRDAFNEWKFKTGSL